MDPFDRLKGNESLKKYFQRGVEGQRLAHAYILEGEEGSGRHTLALAVAEALAGDTPEGAKIARGVSPDVHAVAPQADKKTFTVDAVRAMREEAYLLPNELPFKMFILDKTETMNVQAQNAALKILEEPPANTYFFLLCRSSSVLLPTVRSRAPVLRMERFSPEELDGMLLRDEAAQEKKKSAPEFYQRCLKESGGSYGAALRLLEGGGGEEANEQASELLSCICKREDLLVFILKLPKDRQKYDDFLLAAQKAFRDLLLVRSNGEERLLLFYTSSKEAAQVGRAFAKEELLSLCALFEEQRAANARNANLQSLKYALNSGIYKIIK